MANRNDGLAEVLVQLAGNAATLIERARASAAMRAAQTVDADVVAKKPRDAEAEGHATEEADGQRSALQDIVVQQAMKMHLQDAEITTLKAEVARLTAERDALKAAARAPKKPKPAKPAAKASAPAG